jgi:hypothetical protein
MVSPSRTLITFGHEVSSRNACEYYEQSQERCLGFYEDLPIHGIGPISSGDDPR